MTALGRGKVAAHQELIMTTRDEFDDWLIAMDNKLDQLTEELPRDVADRLDYTPASLSVLERWLLGHYSSLEEIIDTDKYLLDRLSCYVGETLRKTVGGTWSIGDADDANAFAGLPIIKREGKAPECPLSVVSASLDRRKGDYMESILHTLAKG